MKVIMGKYGFNSTLVQLKAELEKHREIIKQSFNSTLVQLKVEIRCCWDVMQKGFNSTLVQLKVSKQGMERKDTLVSILP